MMILLSGPSSGQDLDDLIDGDAELRDSIDLAEDDAEKEKIIKGAVAKALKERIGFGTLIEVMSVEPGLFPPDRLEQLTSVITKHGKQSEIAGALVKLLGTERAVLSPSDINVLNFGVRLSLLFGGPKLANVLTRLAGNDAVDKEWLLPAIGRIAGPKSLALINRYRSDASIISLGNHQNIRAVACAAIIGAAFAGEADAKGKLLAFYEEDVVDLPRFSFYVTWGITDGQPASAIRQAERLRDYCAQRIWLAEHYLDSLNTADLEQLVGLAVQSNALSLTTYLVRRLERSPQELNSFVSLLDHACIIVKARVAEAILRSKDTTAQQKLEKKLHALTQSVFGIERAFAVEQIYDMNREQGLSAAEKLLATEPNELVRIQIQELVARSRKD
ncbi:MAG: hypothetical protein O3B01_15020 [Planctomycetota bacterium]|nr:hypothetical protein [Planctomycetota bacterium]